MFELMDAYSQSAVIKVIGVGGGGGNAVAHMVTAGIDGVEFMCVNTDSQALKHAKVKTALQIGCNITKGLGAGADPEVGRQAAMEDRDRIVELVEGCDMLFITAGMGGGTGTGAAPVVAQVAHELGILTVAVVVDFADVRTVMAETGMAMMGSGAASGEGRARAAAEAAVSSPLLEDINLAGAHGILVNVSAGMDLSIGEFQEVGQIVKQFASDDATVVVGTVIDPELDNQVRVTVVATGLGRPTAAVRSPLTQPREREFAGRADPRELRAEPHMRMVRRPLSSSDYAALDKPTVQRQRAVGDGLRTDADPEDVLDIPAFLRRQAD
ncbi:MAG: cell division protein FtsZ [Gammaproteobacteria bacterium]|nr:MAG: cell division protein FtsZ [Gammaproteobacteria bacterium]